MVLNWKNTEGSILEIQVGGSGYPWEVLDPIGENSAEFGAPAGGGRGDVADRFGRDFEQGGRIKRVGVVRSADPPRWTASITVRERIAKAFSYFGADPEDLLDFPCNIRARQYLGDPLDKTNFTKMIVLGEAYFTDGGPYSAALVKGATGVQDDVMRAFAVSASNKTDIFDVDHANISETALNDAINKVISVGWPRTPQQDRLLNKINDGHRDYIAVTDVDGGTTNPAVILFKDDGSGGLTKSSHAVSAMATYNLLWVTKAGPLVLACGMGGVVYCRYDDLYNGSPTFTVASGIALGTQVNAIQAVNDKVVFAVGQSGKIYRSLDGGLTWTLWNDGAVTTQHLTKIAKANENLIWAAGAAGALVKIENSVPSLVSSGVATAITALAVPRRRDNEVCVATVGTIRRSRNLGATWDVLSLEAVASSSIDDLQFVGDPDGMVMYAIQTNGSSQSRILRDFSGGNAGADVRAVGTFSSPGRVMNSLAMSGPNHGVIVGEVSTTAWVGRISPKAA